MAVLNTIDLEGLSDRSWGDAAREALREAAKRADEPAYPRRVRDLEMDEFWSFVGAKRRQRRTWYGYE